MTNEVVQPSFHNLGITPGILDVIDGMKVSAKSYSPKS